MRCGAVWHWSHIWTRWAPEKVEGCVRSRETALRRVSPWQVRLSAQDNGEALNDGGREDTLWSGPTSWHPGEACSHRMVKELHVLAADSCLGVRYRCFDVFV
jgi:hypothetical protein